VIGIGCVLGDALVNVGVVVGEDVWYPEEWCGDVCRGGGVDLWVGLGGHRGHASICGDGAGADGVSPWWSKCALAFVCGW
jgi:predicted amidohydrolase